MNRIAIAGLSIHGTDLAGLERVRRPVTGAEAAFLRDLADELGASEAVLLATCNRVELAYAREEGDLPGPADLDVLARRLCADHDFLRARLQLRTGADAARHLFRVAASLDSLMLGEDQILAQVREAHARAADIGLTGPLLGPLFHHALAVGKQARAQTDLARHPVSLVNLALATLLERPDIVGARIAVLGAGSMGALLARALKAAGLPPAVIVNRSLPAAQALAAECGARALALADFAAAQAPVDALVSATSAPGLVLDAAALVRLGAATPSGAPLLAVDLAVPRDLPAVDHPSVRVVDLDALRGLAERNRALRASAAAQAEQLVERKVEVWAGRFADRRARHAVTELQQDAAQILERELAGLLGGRLARLPEDDRRAIERWARSTFGRVMHVPVEALKALARELSEDGPDAASAAEPGPDSAPAIAPAAAEVEPGRGPA